MNDTVVYYRGPQSTVGVLPLSDAKFLEDARAVLELVEEQIDAVERRLKTAEGFLKRSELEALIVAVFPDPEKATRVARFVEILDRYFRESQRPLERFHAMFSEQLNEKCKDALTQAQRDALVARTKRLVSDQPFLARQWKAKRLSAAVGRRLEEARIICDLRPVFTPDRSAIDGMIPVTTLKVVASDHDGLPICLEATLTERQLKQLEEAVTTAQKKLSALRTLLATKGLVMPSLSAETSKSPSEPES